MGVPFVGVSRVVRGIDREISLLAPLGVKVLITGELGVGKNLVARLLHQRSQRVGPLVSINCAAVPDDVPGLESWHDEAANGTILLNDVDELSLPMQTRLLRFLEDRQRHPAGDVRLISATRYPLLERSARGTFREDLYYRLNVIHIVIPPLRERPEDVEPLLAHFLEAFSTARCLRRPVLDESALAALAAYTWPGNVRELSAVAEQLLVRHGGGPVSRDDLPIEISREAGWPASPLPRTQACRSSDSPRFERTGPGRPSPLAIVPRHLADSSRRRPH